MSCISLIVPLSYSSYNKYRQILDRFLVQLLPYDTPGKVDGPRGDAFDLVYSSIAPAVRQKVHSADPVLAEWIQSHLYGDVYSSPGVDLRLKQLLMCARLAQANMGEQLFGHALAGLRFGNSKSQLQEALDIGFQVSKTGDEKHKKDAFRIIDLVRLILNA